jgi:lipoyl(octanoyl) transferase
VIFEDWGLIDYEASVARQLALVDDVAAERTVERVVMCTHPPVVTLGRATAAGDVAGWQGPTVVTSRGGRATYHGPNQLVIYPILDLRVARPHVPARDVHGYLRALEGATVAGLAELGLDTAEARVTKVGELSLTGVWVGAHKIASIGIAVRRWVTYHGVAINVANDANAFSGIRPCGFTTNVMTSVESALGRRPGDAECREVFARALDRVFSRARDRSAARVSPRPS